MAPRSKPPATDRTWRGADDLVSLLRPVDDLHPHPENPRVGNVEALAQLISTHGQNRALLALPDGTILAGNHTWKALRSLGWTHVAAVLQEYPPAQAKRILLADNRASDLAEYEPDVLLELLAELQADGGLDGSGWNDDDLEAMLQSHAPPGDEERGGLLALTDVTRPEPRHDAPVGSRWTLVAGDRRHRLVVGDVLTPAAWADLLTEVTGFGPYPTPHAPFSDKAMARDFLFVTPFTAHAGHLLDAWEDKHGEGSVVA